MSRPRISVVIPLYNKESEIETTLRSAVAQSFAPVEILVVDDGSTDRSAERAASVHSPLIRIIRQKNGGVCAARNRAIHEAAGDYIALLDADDRWHPDFLEEIASMIGEYPDCGLYATGFNILSSEGLTPAPCPATRGIVGDFFKESAHRYIAIPSTSCIPKRVFATVGLFPEGMKIGEDLYMWIRIARRYRVCFSPTPRVDYSREASNRSASIYTPERCAHSFEELYDPSASEADREFVARAALGKALVICIKGGTEDSARTARFFAYTRVYRSTLRKIVWLNRLPASWRPRLMQVYNWLAWKIARRGL